MVLEKLDHRFKCGFFLVGGSRGGDCRGSCQQITQGAERPVFRGLNLRGILDCRGQHVGEVGLVGSRKSSEYIRLRFVARLLGDTGQEPGAVDAINGLVCLQHLRGVGDYLLGEQFAGLLGLFLAVVELFESMVEIVENLVDFAALFNPQVRRYAANLAAASIACTCWVLLGSAGSPLSNFSQTPVHLVYSALTAS